MTEKLKESELGEFLDSVYKDKLKQELESIVIVAKVKDGAHVLLSGNSIDIYHSFLVLAAEDEAFRLLLVKVVAKLMNINIDAN